MLLVWIHIYLIFPHVWIKVIEVYLSWLHADFLSHLHVLVEKHNKNEDEEGASSHHAS